MVLYFLLMKTSIEKSKDECFYFIKRDQIESLLSANDNKIIIKVDQNNKLSIVKE